SPPARAGARAPSRRARRRRAARRRGRAGRGALRAASRSAGSAGTDSRGSCECPLQPGSRRAPPPAAARGGAAAAAVPVRPRSRAPPPWRVGSGESFASCCFRAPGGSAALVLLRIGGRQGPKACELLEPLLEVRPGAAAVARPVAVGAERPRPAVGETERQDLFEAHLEAEVLDRHHELDAPVELAAHQVGRADEVAHPPSRAPEAEDARVLEEAA